MATKAWSALLVMALGLGPVGAAMGGWAWYLQTARPTSVAVAAVDRSADQELASEVAQRVVVAWLTSTQDHPGELVALVKDAGLVGLPQEPAQVRDLTVAAVVFGDRVWTVTVAATVTDSRQTARRYFQVPVQVSSGTVTVLTLPSPVAAPSIALSSSTGYKTQLASGSAPGVTVSQFLSAYLAGSGDLNRYLTPGSALGPIHPAPYTSVRLVELRAATAIDAAKTPSDGQQLRVLAIATAMVTDRQSSPVEYALTLRARAGRWEISAIDLSPALGPASLSPATNPSSASSAAPSPRPTSSTS